MDFLLIIFTSILLFLFLTVSLFILRIFTGKSIRNKNYPPVKGTVFHQFLYFNRLYDYQTEVAKTHSTYRLLAVDHSQLYTADTRNIEHVLKTNFASYSKGAFTQSILSDIFGQGIFVVDGEKWKQQRKLASFEFSTRVLRDVSCSVFRRNAAKLVRVVLGISSSGGVFDMQDGRCADADDILPDGFRVRKGDNINYITYAMGRMPYIWGKDADDFRPERWLETGIFKPESPFKFVAFHAGPRICLGKDFAYRQMKIVAMALLSFFRFKLADETKPVTYRTMFTLHIDGSLPMIAVPRTT